MDREDIRRGVTDFLIKPRRDEFINAFREIKSFFKNYAKSAEGKKIIYRVTGRDDYQDGEIKTDESIIEKIETKRAKQLAEGKEPTYSIDKMEDIAGIRLICVYPSDADYMRKYIRERQSRLELISKPESEWEEKDSGYRAWHIIVRPQGYSKSIKCEVQIVTLLQETWSFKTHGLVYKGENVEEKYQKHTRLLSDSLQAIDKQSELVKDQIEEKRRVEQQRRLSLIKEHLILLLGAEEGKRKLDETLSNPHNPNGIDFSQLQNSEQALRQLTHLCEERLASSPISEEDVSLISGQIKEYENKYRVFEQKSKYKTCRALSLMASLCAVVGESDKFTIDALDYADRLIKYSKEKEELENRADALLHKGWILFCLKKLEEAIRRIEEALRLAETLPKEESLVKNKAKNDWAYFVAELVDENRRTGKKKFSSDEIEQKKSQALRYIDEVVSKVENKEQLKWQWEDTRGFVYIALGEKLDEIEDGRRICKDAYTKSLKYATSKQQEIAKLYFNKHTRRALERSLEFFD